MTGLSLATDGRGIEGQLTLSVFAIACFVRDFEGKGKFAGLEQFPLSYLRGS